MALKKEAALITGLSVMAVVYAIHTNATPTQADIQALPAGVADIDMSERQATVMSVAVVSGISLLAQDPTIFVMGAIATVGMAVWTRHSNYKDGESQTVGGVSSAGGPNSPPPAAIDTAEVASEQPYQMFSDNGFVGS